MDILDTIDDTSNDDNSNPMETLNTLHTDILALDIMKMVGERVNLPEEATVKNTLGELGMDSLAVCELEIDLEREHRLKGLNFDVTDTCIQVAESLKKAHNAQYTSGHGYSEGHGS